jgi:hypothetical protein
MSIGAIFIGLALLILSIPIVAGPVVNKRRARLSLADEAETPHAPDRYQAVLVAMRDLDFDHDLGVISDEDYTGVRGQLLAEAVQARAVAGLESSTDVEDRIEAAVRAHRGKRASPILRPVNPGPEIRRVCYHCGLQMGKGDKFCTTCGTAAAQVCPYCDRQAEPADRFCAGCGTPLIRGVMA